MNLKVIEPIKNYLKEFTSPDEFNLFYQSKKDELDNLTTHKLNKMYYIKGYHITKIQGKLMLKKWDKIEKQKIEENQKKELKEEVQNLKEDMKKIKEAINRIIDVINGKQ